MLSASVSNIELYRGWLDNEELDLSWLIERLTGPFVRTEPMIVGEAFHKAIEDLELVELELPQVSANGYSFDITCDIDLCLPSMRELPCSKQYGDLQVRGRVDAIQGNMIIDHKTTGYFDPDRLLEGYQWRYYLDMAHANRFRWNVFVLRETDDPKHYEVSDFHKLEQARYPELHEDCLKLASSYHDFAKTHLYIK